MKLIVGLGNPGKEYENTRHNFGFMAIMKFWEKNKTSFSDWKEKNNALVSTGQIGNEKILLTLPQTFMNNSGVAVSALAKYFGLLPKIFTKLLSKPRDLQNIWVLHDDVDLPFETLRISKGSGAAGHKGVESIKKHLGSLDLPRFRLGINNQYKTNKPLDQFVLDNFSAEEKSKIDEVLEKTVNALETALREGLDKAMNEYNA